MRDLRGTLLARTIRNKAFIHGEIFTLSSADGKTYKQNCIQGRLSPEGEDIDRNELVYTKKVFFPFDTKVQAGDLVEDNYGQKWFAETFLPVLQYNETVKIDTRLRLASFTCNIYRYPANADRGYTSVSTTPSSAATRNGIVAYFNLNSPDVLHIKISPLEKVNIQMMVRSFTDIQMGDMVEVFDQNSTSVGYFKVMTIDSVSFKNLLFCELETDTRTSV